ncbi:MAG: hypothetical protein AAGG02_07410 [Cyanobacteria bacterium P01_H01_bin.15]
MNSVSLGKSRPMWQVVLLSGVTGLLYYGWYKWVIQDELKTYLGKGWSGALCLVPFVLGVAVPQLLWRLDPDVPPVFGWLSLLGIVWIYIVQFRLYRTVNQLFREVGQVAPLRVWWLFVPGLNLVVGLRQIHFLSQYWGLQHGQKVEPDPLAESLPFLFSEKM